jgi:Fic family protein
VTRPAVIAILNAALYAANVLRMRSVPAIAKCSPDTALRDINDLLARGVLRKTDAGGRSTSYVLAEH